MTTNPQGQPCASRTGLPLRVFLIKSEYKAGDKGRGGGRESHHDKGQTEISQNDSHGGADKGSCHIPGGIEYRGNGHGGENSIRYVIKEGADEAGLYLSAEEGEGKHTDKIGHDGHNGNIYSYTHDLSASSSGMGKSHAQIWAAATELIIMAKPLDTAVNT